MSPTGRRAESLAGRAESLAGRAPKLRILGGALALAFVAGMAPAVASSDDPSSSSSATPSQQSTDDASAVLVPQAGAKADIAPVVDIIAPKVKVGTDSSAKKEDNILTSVPLLAAWTSSLLRQL
ncbi:MAG: hypothetical protein Q3979_03920 [Actinomycetaceae bacterium]|nr:hypothetical protein [Actinomycetaceae bacterium]